MGLFGIFGGRGREGSKDMEKMAAEQARSDAYKAMQSAEGQPAEEKASRAPGMGEISEAQLAGMPKAQEMMDYYKQDPDIRLAMAKDQKATEAMRLAIAEAAGGGASQEDLAELGMSILEERFGLGGPNVVMGTEIEGEQKKAA